MFMVTELVQASGAHVLGLDDRKVAGVDSAWGEEVELGKLVSGRGHGE